MLLSIGPASIFQDHQIVTLRQVVQQAMKTQSETASLETLPALKAGGTWEPRVIAQADGVAKGSCRLLSDHVVLIGCFF